MKDVTYMSELCADNRQKKKEKSRKRKLEMEEMMQNQKKLLKEVSDLRKETFVAKQRQQQQQPESDSECEEVDVVPTTSTAKKSKIKGMRRRLDEHFFLEHAHSTYDDKWGVQIFRFSEKSTVGGGGERLRKNKRTKTEGFGMWFSYDVFRQLVNAVPEMEAHLKSQNII